MLVDRAEPTQGTDQLTRHSRERRSSPQTVGPQTDASGSSRAHSRYQPADPHRFKHKLKSQLLDRVEPTQDTNQGPNHIDVIIQNPNAYQNRVS